MVDCGALFTWRVICIVDVSIKFISGLLSFLFDEVLVTAETDPHFWRDDFIRTEQMFLFVSESDGRPIFIHFHKFFLELVYFDIIIRVFVLNRELLLWRIRLLETGCDSDHFSVLLPDERTDWVFGVKILGFRDHILFCLQWNMFFKRFFILKRWFG